MWARVDHVQVGDVPVDAGAHHQTEPEEALRSAILDAVAQAYGLVPQDVRIFKGEYDRNIRITDPTRGTWLIKVSDQRTPEVALDWQETVLAAVAGSEVGVATPRLLRTETGDLRVEVRHGGAVYAVRVVSWIDGHLLSTLPAVPRRVHVASGRVSAQLTHAFADLTPPAGLPEHAWLTQRSTREIRAALARLPDDSRTNTVAEVVTQFERHHAARLARVPWGVVHHDLHDAHAAPLVADPAVAAAYATLKTDDPFDRFAAVVEGYEEYRELSEDEHELVRPLALLRLCTNWSVWNARAITAADPEYALHRSRDMWDAIGAMVDNHRSLGL